MKFAYADPPYFGCCALYDHFHGDDGLCWNDLDTHGRLIDRLTREYPDGWAMSASTPSLRVLLPLVLSDVRIGAWVKTFSAFKRGVRPAYAWEPVLWRGGRNPSVGFPHPPPVLGGEQTTPKDFFETHIPVGLAAPITLQKGLTGAKPEAFCEWVLQLLNYRSGDTLVDLFPGTGIMAKVAARIGAGTAE